MTRISVLLLLSLVVSSVLGAWDALYSPLSDYTYIKLSTNDIIPIYSRADNNLIISNEQIVDTVIKPPTKGNYSLALANGELYAIYSPSTITDKLLISQLNYTSKIWNMIDYSTTVKNGLQFNEDSTVITSVASDGNQETIYIYGGAFNDTISSRLLEFNPNTGTLGQIISTVSPTAFLGAGKSIMDPSGESNILIGGKANSGWVSMFQIAVWEYQSWTFKTVKDAKFSVNSRINPLVLPVFQSDSSIENFLVIGGELNDELSNPFVLNLNMSEEWKWENVTGFGDFDVDYSLGAVVINKTLISVGVSDSKKRDENYSIKLFDAGTFEKKDSLVIESEEVKVIESSQLEVTKTVVETVSATTSILSTSTSSSVLLNQGKITNDHIQQKQKTIALAVVLPVIGVIVLVILIIYLFKRWKKSSLMLDSSSETSSTNSADFFKEMNQLDNQSISSWNVKRDEYERSIFVSKLQSAIKFEDDQKPQNTFEKPRKSIDQFTFDQLNNNNNHDTSPIQPLKKLKNIYRTSNSQSQHLKYKKSHEAFADPEDYQDRQELTSAYGHYNRSRISVFSTTNLSDISSMTEPSSIDEKEKEKDSQTSPVRKNKYKNEEEEKIDEFLNERDVQVLVSSKRRSKLRVTNPDLEISDKEEDEEIKQRSTSESSESDNLSLNRNHHNEFSIVDLNNLGTLELNDEKEYFDDVLKIFDNELQD